jgi:hypothetical protein
MVESSRKQPHLIKGTKHITIHTKWCCYVEEMFSAEVVCGNRLHRKYLISQLETELPNDHCLVHHQTTAVFL